MVAAAACGQALDTGADVPAALIEVERIGMEAEGAIRAGRWDEASALFRRQAEAASKDPHLAGDRAGALYNVACVESRAGRRDEAVRAFAECVAGGLATIERPTTSGGWAPVATVLTLPHVLCDPDLDAIRDHPGFAEALRPILAASESSDREAPGAPGPAGGPRAAIIVLSRFRAAPPGAEGEPPAFEPDTGTWADDGAGPPRVVVAMTGPIRRGTPDEQPLWGAARRPDPPRPGGAPVETTGASPEPAAGAAPGGTPPILVVVPPRRAWLLEDGDDRWAVAAVRAAVDRLAADPRVDPERIYLAGTFDPEVARATWAAALAMPERIAGFAADGVATPRAAWADALADAVRRRAGKPPWTVVLGTADDVAAGALAAAGIGATRAKGPEMTSVALGAWGAGR